MLEAIKRALLRPTPTSPAAAPSAGPGAHELPVAACALLLELAHADDEFSGEERRHIQEALARHFGLGAEAAAELMTLAQDRLGQATDLHQFTSVLAKQYDEGQRMVLAEVLWRVVYADGKLSQHESYLMRKLANLLDLRPGYLAEARKRVLPEGSEPL
jgi:uncharacterized tellurite resistance protein B-like protein